MKIVLGCLGILILGLSSAVLPSSPAQNAPAGSAAPSTLTADYPAGNAGVLIQAADWLSISAVFPSKMRTKNALAQSFTYGAVRGAAEADYTGDHAVVQIMRAQPTICICRFTSIPGDPLLVKLHPQKGLRELDGGKLPILGGKIAEANKTDVVAIEASHPENTVWLIRPLQPLPPGEYAVMLGSQNFSIFPFTVSANETGSSAETH